jgi:hypothetical protein
MRECAAPYLIGDGGDQDDGDAADDADDDVGKRRRPILLFRHDSGARVPMQHFIKESLGMFAGRPANNWTGPKAAPASTPFRAPLVQLGQVCAPGARPSHSVRAR